MAALLAGLVSPRGSDMGADMAVNVDSSTAKMANKVRNG